MNSHVPSRHDNPFATCWTKPGAIPFRFTPGDSATGLVERFAALGWRGAIIGPHGSGKSTLLEALKPEFEATGRTVISVALHEGERWSSRDVYDSIPPTPALVIIDGYEQLTWLQRRYIESHCRRHKVGLLVTSHIPTRLPTLISLEPDRALVNHLVAELCARATSPITPGDVTASHACHGSNVREIFFDLYDRHEQKTRTS